MTKTVKKLDKAIDNKTPEFLIYAILLVGLALRLIYVNSDPPLDLAKGQSLWTDPSQYVFFARNFTYFGDLDLFSPSNLTFFKYSFISLLSIPIFRILGSGYWQSNFVAVIISFMALVTFALTIKKVYGKVAGVLAALFAGVSYIFVMHNRVP